MTVIKKDGDWRSAGKSEAPHLLLETTSEDGRIKMDRRNSSARVFAFDIHVEFIGWRGNS